MSSQETATPPPERASVVVGVGQPIFQFTSIFVADKKGFWRDENLDVKLQIFNSGSESQQALLADVTMIDAGSFTVPMVLSAGGVPTVIFGLLQDAVPFRLMTKPEITSTSQLPGKVLGISKPGSLTDQLTRIVLNRANVDPGSVTYQQTGGSPSRLAALESGTIDGSLLDSPSYLLAQKAGYTTLVNVAEELKGVPYGTLEAKKATIEANHDVFLRFMRGAIKGAQYATDPANEDEVVQIVAGYTGQKAEDLKLAYEGDIPNFAADAKPELEGIDLALKGIKQFGNIEGIDKVTAQDLYYPDLQREAATSLGIK